MHIKDKYCKDCGTLDRNIAVSLRTTPPEGQPTVAMPIYKEQQGYALGEEFSPNARIALRRDETRILVLDESISEDVFPLVFNIIGY